MHIKERKNYTDENYLSGMYAEKTLKAELLHSLGREPSIRKR